MNKKILPALLCILSFLISCSSEQEAHDNELAKKCFQFELGLDPSSVKNIYAKQMVWSDSARAWYRFEASQNFLDQLKSRGFNSITEKQFKLHSEGRYKPLWWNVKEHDLLYEKNGWSKNFQNSTAVLAYDKDLGLIYFCHDAAD